MCRICPKTGARMCNQQECCGDCDTRTAPPLKPAYQPQRLSYPTLQEPRDEPD